MSKSERMIRIGLKAVMLYLVVNGAAWLLANALLFHPPKRATLKMPQPIISIPVAGQTVAALYLPNKDAKYTVLFSHGNAADLATTYPFLLALQQQGFAVLSYDYEGYGLSTGFPSESHTYRDVRAVYHYLRQQRQVPPSRIISMGNSLGAAVATYLSSTEPTARLILMSPFVSAFRVITRVPLFVFDRYNNAKRIQVMTTPLLILHGTADSVIPFWHAQQLYALAKPPKTIVPLWGSTHNRRSPAQMQRFWQAIQRFVSDGSGLSAGVAMRTRMVS